MYIYVYICIYAPSYHMYILFHVDHNSFFMLYFIFILLNIIEYL